MPTKRLRYSCRTKAGEVSLLQEPPDGFWRLYFEYERDGVYGTPEAAVEALANGSVHMPKGLSLHDWQGPKELSGWKLETDDDLPWR